MPARPHVSMSLAAKFANEENILETRMKLMGASVSAGTLKQYQSGKSRMQAFLAEFVPPRKDLTKDMFIMLLGSMMEQGHAGTSTGEGYLYAIQFYQRFAGLWGSWATDEDVVAAARGLRYAGKADRKETGSITRPMLDALAKWTASAHPEFPSMPRCHKIMWGAALRVKQGAFLRIGDTIEDIDEDEETSKELTVRKDKRVQQGSRRGQVHFKPINVETALWIGEQEEARFAQGAKHGDWLFLPSEWRYKDLLAVIKEASISLKWPTDIEWVTHSHRHGGTAKIQAEALNQATVMSSGTRRHYTKKNAAKTNAKRSRPLPPKPRRK